MRHSATHERMDGRLERSAETVNWEGRRVGDHDFHFGTAARRPSQKDYFNFASAVLMASKFGRSFGVSVCSLYCTTPFLSITNAARAEVSPTPASIGKITSYALAVVLFRSLASVMPIFSFCAQASCAKGLSTLMPMTSAPRPW